MVPLPIRSTLAAVESGPRPYDDTLFDWSSNEFHRNEQQRLRRERRRRRLRWFALGLAVVVALGVVAYLGVPLHWYDTKAYQSRYAIGPYQDDVPGAIKNDLTKTISRLERFVEQQRNGRYAQPVVVATISEIEFQNQLASAAGVVGDDVATIGVAPGTGEVTGFYETQANVLYVRGSVIDDTTRIVLVHALAHAYDDQRFAMPSAASADDAAMARHALAEGDAVWVERAYLETLSLDLRCPGLQSLFLPYDADCTNVGYRQQGSRGDQAERQFTYALGTRFVDYLHARGGSRAVDRAFSQPPVSTAQIVEPATYLEPVPPPAGRGRRLGAFALSVLVSDGRLGPGIRGYLLGWRADTAADSGSCLADTVRLTSPSAATRLGTLLKSWRQRSEGRSFRRSAPTTIVLERCAR